MTLNYSFNFSVVSVFQVNSSSLKKKNTTLGQTKMIETRQSGDEGKNDISSKILKRKMRTSDGRRK